MEPAAGFNFVPIPELIKNACFDATYDFIDSDELRMWIKPLSWTESILSSATQMRLRLPHRSKQPLITNQLILKSSRQFRMQNVGIRRIVCKQSCSRLSTPLVTLLDEPSRPAWATLLLIWETTNCRSKSRPNCDTAWCGSSAQHRLPCMWTLVVELASATAASQRNWCGIDVDVSLNISSPRPCATRK